MNDDQPTVEQSLHSIALSLININKELVDIRRIHKDTLRFAKSEARQTIIRPTPSVGAKIRRFFLKIKVKKGVDIPSSRWYNAPHHDERENHV